MRDLETDYKPFVPTQEQSRRMDAVRAKAKDLAYAIRNCVPGSREQSSALSRLDEVVFWANAGITRNDQGGPNGQTDPRHVETNRGGG